MKKIFTLFAITALVLCSCTEDDSFYPQTVNPGDKIAFGGTLDMKNAGKQTRTVYGDRLEGYTEIKWYQGDQVRIYCAKGVDETSKSVTKCDYTVLDPINSTNNQEDDTNNIKNNKYEPTHYTRLGVVEGETEMCWADNTTHTFYGVYPASGQLNAAGKADAESEVAAGYLELSEGKLKGYLPNKQTPLGSVKYTSEDIKDSEGNKLNTHYTMQPSMRYAYMVAKTPTTPVESVPLTFHPVVTAVEITLLNNTKNTVDGVESEAEVKNITMVSITAEKAICGEFETTIAGTADGNKNKLVSTGDAYKTVAIPVDDLTLKFGDKLTFTAFIILDESTSNVDLSTIKVNILAGVNSKTATLAANSNTDGGIIVQAKKKNFLNNIPLNLGTVSYTVTPDNWLEYVPDTYVANGVTQNRTVASLSIPGAGGAASGNKSGTAFVITDEASRQQNLSITELWAQGVRCFEFLVDKNSSLGSEDVYCNLVSTGKTLKAAMDDVANCLKLHPKEFAVVIVGYQEKDITTWTRNAATFANNFHSWWAAYDCGSYIDENGNSVDIGKGVLTGETTIASARGNIFMICRPTAMGLDGRWYSGMADDGSYNSETGPLQIILGWGTHPDQWYARGFGNLRTTDPTNTSSDKYANADFSNTDNRPYYASTDSKPEVAEYPEISGAFEYGLASAPGNVTYSTMSKAYVQEWRRVMPTETLQKEYNINDIPTNVTAGGSGTEYYYNWTPSSNEKWNDVTTALTMALNKTGGYALYINSLCGYFIDGSIAQSYQPLATFQIYYEWHLFQSNYQLEIDDKYRTATSLGGISADAPNRTDGANWGPYLPTGGYKGNIGAYASWINNLFYNHLLTLQANGTLDGTKGTGIVLMDRVSNNASTDAAGYYIPRIILSNNEFKYTTTPSANGLSITVATEEVNSDNSDDYKFAAPEKR